MSFDRNQHDIKNAILFLETFPLMMKQLDPNSPDFKKERDELLDVYAEKIKVIKAGIRT